MKNLVFLRTTLLLIGLVLVTGCGLKPELIKERQNMQAKAKGAVAAAQRALNEAKAVGAEKYGQPEYGEAATHLGTAKTRLATGNTKTVSRSDKDKSYKDNNNKKSFSIAMTAFAQAVDEANACIAKARIAKARALAAQAIEAAKQAVGAAETEGAAEYAPELFKEAQNQLAAAEQAYTDNKLAEAKELADSATAAARKAKKKAMAARAKLAREKNARDSSWSRVKELQAQLAEALKDSNYDKILRLMIDLSAAEVDFSKLTISHGLGGEDQVEKYTQQHDAATKLQKRYRNAVTVYESAQQALASAKRKRKSVESELGRLRKRVEDAKALVDSKNSEMERLKETLQSLESE